MIANRAHLAHIFKGQYRNLLFKPTPEVVEPTVAALRRSLLRRLFNKRTPIGRLTSVSFYVPYQLIASEVSALFSLDLIRIASCHSFGDRLIDRWLSPRRWCSFDEPPLDPSNRLTSFTWSGYRSSRHPHRRGSERACPR
jgi:hypothetical protein